MKKMILSLVFLKLRISKINFITEFLPCLFILSPSISVPVLFVLSIFENVSLCSQSWIQSHSIDQTSLKLMISCLSFPSSGVSGALCHTELKWSSNLVLILLARHLVVRLGLHLLSKRPHLYFL